MRKYTDAELWSLFLTKQAVGVVQVIREDISDSPRLSTLLQKRGQADFIKFATAELLSLGENTLIPASKTRTPAINEGTFIEFYLNYDLLPLILHTENSMGWQTYEEIELGSAYVYRQKGSLQYVKGNSDTAFTGRNNQREDKIKTKLPGFMLRRKITTYVDGKKVNFEIKYIHLVFRDYKRMTAGQLTGLQPGTILETKDGLLFIKLQGEWFLQIPGEGRDPFETRNIFGLFHILSNDIESVWNILWRNYTLRSTPSGALEAVIQIPQDLKQSLRAYLTHEFTNVEAFSSDLFSLIQQQNAKLASSVWPSSKKVEEGPGILVVTYPKREAQADSELWYKYGLLQSRSAYKNLPSEIAYVEPPVPFYDTSTHFGVAVFYSPLSLNELKKHRLSLYVSSSDLIDQICAAFRKEPTEEQSTALRAMKKDPGAALSLLYKFTPGIYFFSDVPLEEIIEASRQKLLKMEGSNT